MTAFLGWNLLQQWYSFSERKTVFFSRCIIVKQKILATMMQLYTSNNEESRITVELKSLKVIAK